MRAICKLFLGLGFALSLSIALSACSYSVTGNELGSEPVNEKEKLKYEQAIVRCYKTGGTRVVKVMGKLRCY